MTNSQTVIKNPSWWRRRSSLERWLLVVSLFLGLLSALLAAALAFASSSGHININPETLPTMSALEGNNKLWSGGNSTATVGPSDPRLCLTEGCVHTASEVLENMDRSVEPCDDFYKFACGGFKKRVIPEDKSSLSIFSVINDRLQEQLKSLVAAPRLPKEPLPFSQAKALYAACMDKKKIEESGGERVKGLLKEFGGWPVLDGDSWNEAAFSWKDSVYKLRAKGFSVDNFIDFSVTVDVKNSSKRVIDLDQASLGLSREYLSKGLSHRLVEAYFSYMVDIAVLFGADKSRAERELHESLEFEMKLANISLPLEERRNATKLYNPMNLETLERRFGSIPWREYLSTILAPVALSSRELVVVAVPSFIEKLETLLQQTPKRVQANYAMWRAASSTVTYLSEAFRNRQLVYSTAITGKTERESRWKECVDITASSLGLAVGSLYVREFFKEDAKKSALEITRAIREQMYKILETVDWMDEETRERALKKARSMTTHIAYPDELLDDEKLEEFYKGLTITEESYFDAILNMTKFGTDYTFGRLRTPVNKTEWISHGRPAVVNAYYSSIENSIQFPAGILQGSFFSNSRPRYMNYGAIGFVIGHEITHGFDDQGRQFDEEGNLVDWWAPETKSRYLERAQCIIEQYGNYTDAQVNLKLNGINTQGENIADNGGIKQAYRAYKAWASQNPEEARLPGLQEFTPAQMLWISAANSWCSVYRDEALSNRITTGFHSPGEFRVRGPLSNMPEFAEDFSCPLGSRMNPTHKCSVW